MSICFLLSLCIGGKDRVPCCSRIYLICAHMWHVACGPGVLGVIKEE